MTRLQKTGAIIALAFCFAGAVAGELWEASRSPPSPSQGRAAEQQHAATNSKTEKEDPTEAIARYNRYLAVFTGILAGFTAILAIATIALGILNVFQIRLARSEFLVTNRPLLRVRYFKRTDGKRDTEIDIRFTVVNVGKTVAHLLGSSVVVDYFYENSLPTPVYAAGKDVSGQRKFEVGVTDEYIVRWPKPGKSPFVPLHIYGLLVYADDEGNTRTTAFCRRWIDSAERFLRVEDPDYEYED